MTSALRKPRLHAIQDTWPAGLAVGWIESVDLDGRVTVDFPGNARGPVPARAAVRVRGEALPLEHGRIEVLLAFPAGEPGPVVVGLVSERLVEPEPADGASLDARVDGREVTIAATDRVEIRCGEGSIALSADGRIVIKGRELVSRAAENNKIRGASVLIN